MKRVAIDFETYPISEKNGTAPKPVCLSYFDGQAAGILLYNEIEDYLLGLPEDVEIIAHNIQFEAAVIFKHFSKELGNWFIEKVKKDQVWCTLISEQIIDIASTVKTLKDRSPSLSSLVMKYLGIDISEDKKSESSWRTRYEELENVPVSVWPKEAIDYSEKDAIYAYKVRERQKLTNYDSVKAAISLGVIADVGFLVDKQYVQEQIKILEEKIAPIKDRLLEANVAKYDKLGRFTKKQKVFRDLIENVEEHPLYTSADGSTVAIDKKALKTYVNPLAELWSEYSHSEKLLGTYFKTLESAEEIIRTSYNAVVETGRTSSRGSKLLPALNMQNMPRSGGVREALIARPGNMLCSIDYGSLELVCCAQQLYSLYKRSSMRNALNQGDKPVDLHSVTGAKLMSIDVGREVSYDEFISNKKIAPYKDYRQLAKPINLGYPGGIGPRTMVSTAKDTYGVDLTIKEAVYLKKVFLATYPELGSFLNHDVNMLKTGNIIKYKNGSVSDEYYYVVKGLTRRGCTYNAACNGLLMQSPAAMGAKTMLWEIFLATRENDSITPLAFIHDEVLFEIRDDDNLEKNVERMAYLLLDSMKTVLPDVRLSVEADVGPRWRKEGLGWSKTYWRD